MKQILPGFVIIVLIFSGFISGCSGEPSEDFNDLISRLERTGADVIPGDTENDGHVFLVSFRNVSVDGETIQVYEFDDADTARQEADFVSNDGYSVTRTPELESTSDTTSAVNISWIAPPHFFRSGRLIVLYVGNDTAIRDSFRDTGRTIRRSIKQEVHHVLDTSLRYRHLERLALYDRLSPAMAGRYHYS